MKKNIFAIMFFCISISDSIGQSIIADPAVNLMNTTATNQIPLDPLAIPIGVNFLLKIPILNYNLTNALPSGSCKIRIGLGSRLELNPSFNVSTMNTSNYFNWTTESSSGEVQLLGNLIAALPNNFADTIFLQVRGKVLGSANILTNFLVTNHNTTVFLSDQNSANNNTALAYTVVENDGGPLPVTFTSLTTTRALCNIKVDFKTENEVNVDRFEIEVSKDGVSFNKQGTLLAQNAGNYNFIFDVSNVSAKNLFVRIKSVDIDGQYQYSTVSKVNGNCTESKNNLLFPNPAPTNISYFNLRNETGSFNGTYYISISDISGRMVAKKKIILVNQSQFRYYHISLPAGEYIVQLFSEKGDQVYTSKWQKL